MPEHDRTHLLVGLPRLAGLLPEAFVAAIRFCQFSPEHSGHPFVPPLQTFPPLGRHALHHEAPRRVGLAVNAHDGAVVYGLRGVRVVSPVPNEVSVAPVEGRFRTLLDRHDSHQLANLLLNKKSNAHGARKIPQW
eukprot:1125743-Prorocentrum_minimum.AAC.1